ncbi:26S PROTEASOME NON-ATPASE REGULATORY SUBUNIT 3/COP9 SIGNALOSOME COMPLEX SUBUNIT 3 [Salix koriyanagi]|uniref:26S PROTEASOME NON-ATPASE REGULATORY SUBUNIT 3/COP9 SIGNALOSOME COMPLEX SUBUNIT 3 n=1 Tax=Salix koriyanagi TaxID=2511006 RepID=A0A9Q0TCF5_9ROSI|nr:26S PROTEASOME NON-ATPASE REGULATORY SUBUNIT 3/COP9 SIGNALOSOME COMPLEX SUBUNIT 3 [Salix koriyanagi]
MSTEAQIKSTPSTPTPCNSITSPAEYSLKCLMDIASLIEIGSCKKEVRHIARAVRLTNSLKKKLAEPNLLSAFLDFALSPRSELHNRLSGLLYHQGYDLEMEADSATSAPAKRISRELEIYCYFLMLLFLIDQNRYSEAKAFSSAAVARVKNLSRGACPTAGALASRVYFYYSYVHEILDELAEIRRTGLCNISISYSRISLAEVADRLKLHSRNLLPDFENIVAKAIHDGAINAKIDHANGWLISKETRDIYATAEPQAAFSSRIAFYLNLYNETVRASHFPSDNDTHEKRRSASQVLYGEVLELLEEVRDKYFK